MKEELIRQKAIETAEHQNCLFPQYRGHWDDWHVGWIMRKIKTKFGVAFEEGDIVLVKPVITISKNARRKDKRCLTAYSWRNQLNTRVPYNDVFIGTQGWPVEKD